MHAGARLSAADKTRLKTLNKEESTLSTQFTNKLLAATKAGALVVDDQARLAGLSAGDIASAAQAAQGRGLSGKWVLPLQNTTQQPQLQSLSDRATRQALFTASWTRAEHGDANDTRKTIARIAEIRAEQAKLLASRITRRGSWKTRWRRRRPRRWTSCTSWSRPPPTAPAPKRPTSRR